MPPVGPRRKKRKTTKAAPIESEDDGIDKSELPQDRIASEVVTFQPGFPSLAPELFLEILSYFGTVSDDYILANPEYLPSECRERIDLLRALSQTCRSLRSQFFGIAWERFAPCICSESDGKVWWKVLGDSMEKQCKGLVKSPHLLPLVRTVTVTLTRYSVHRILAALVSCLESLPNLHTLQVLHAHAQMTSALGQAFKNVSLPSIRTVILPSCAHNIIKCCPEVRDVTCNEHHGSQLIGSLVKGGCNKVERFAGISPRITMVKRLAKLTPSLHTIVVQTRTAYCIEDLVHIKSLRTIEIRHKPDNPVTLENERIEPHVEAAKTVLKGSKVEGVKVVRVRLHEFRHLSDGRAYWHETKVEAVEV
ncbi:hypothetical protein JAAARDRAFT_191574 [Jaapia argillacea MUCL 33604]|uniref:F-box domain-containing protein n=1 Tax=Jaapia argillacea MUCL 33604 TaxID=933084 RepID=A0A067PZC4_9AGAM|nr:hypothetical protein JAAARDRAFT_191574 [Jaapia argillacea MUCL 33604]